MNSRMIAVFERSGRTMNSLMFTVCGPPPNMPAWELNCTMKARLAM